MCPAFQIEHKNLREKISERIREDILNAKFEPGERLLVDQLAAEMGVSKTPLREALVRLEEEGFVTSVPRGGTYVKDFTAKEIEEIYEIREMLESLAGRLLAQSIRDKQIEISAKTCQLFAESIEKGNIKTCIRNDFKFHSQILEMCGNDNLKQILNTLQLKIISIMHLKPSQFNLEIHLEIFRAIANGNSDLTEKLIREHIAQVKNAILLEMLKDS